MVADAPRRNSKGAMKVESSAQKNFNLCIPFKLLAPYSNLDSSCTHNLSHLAYLASGFDRLLAQT